MNNIENFIYEIIRKAFGLVLVALAGAGVLFVLALPELIVNLFMK